MNAAKLTADHTPPVLLRGTRRGLEILIDNDGGVDAAAIARTLEERLAEAPGFFSGSDVTIAVSGTLPAGSLTILDGLTARFGLRIAEVRSAAAEVEAIPAPDPSDAIPLAIDDGISAPESSSRNFSSQPTETVASGSAPNLASADAPKLCVGPVRSGVVLDAPGHLVIVGDVNPGAEIRAAGCIVVLGALRGTAHAGYGENAGFILALKLQPQQLRIAGRIARAGDGEAPPESAEIAYVKNGRIVVDAYKGRLPSGAIAQG
ncbi:MAG TPA: septum site-determining protein MinC [Kofleriaceae bacterium]|nr:septum site-determining protein MinC [Kofleriaceae bacterium]